MKTTDPLSFSDAYTVYPVARIDAQDESYVLPIREYLETHGVEVVVNQAPLADSMYHIVAGDATYVKQIFSRESARGAKRLGIVLGGGQTTEEFSGKIKIIIAHPTPMTASEVMETFEFFFTEGKSHLDLRNDHETRTVHEDVQAREDHARVTSIIADVFKEKKKPRKKRMQALALGVLICVGIFVIPILWYGLSIIGGGVAISSASRALRQGNFGAVVWNIRIADYWIHQGKFVLDTITTPLEWLGWEDRLRGQQRLVSFMSDAARAENQIQELTMLAGRVAGGLLNQVDTTSSGTTAASDISLLRISLYTLGNTLGLAQAELQMLLADRTFPFSIQTFLTKGTGVVVDLSDIRQSTADTDKLLSLFLSLAGFKEPRTYLILLQNSMELRPTGGFIGSVAVASFADGRLTNLDIQDVYTFDGQLKGHVDPPIPIKDLLSQEHWYLRDSNWDPDFKEAGARAAWFYQKETGSTVDGVIGISTPFITDLLGATGPIELSDYNDRISADNFYGKSMYYTKNDFFPGSTQKKDFLGSLSRAMMTTITTGKNINTTKLFRAITTALSGHDLLMMFNDSQLQSLVEHYGWAGRVPPEVGCAGIDSSFCIFDPFVSVEANMGVNKVNYFVTRTLDRTITVNTDGTRTGSETLAIRNGSGSQDKNLPYRVYVRFVLPPGSSVKQVMTDGVAVAASAIDLSAIASGLSAVGITLDVPASAEKKLTVSYTEAKPLTFGAEGAVLDSFTQKQPGVSDEKIHTTILYPNTWVAGIEDNRLPGTPRDFIAKPGQLEYNIVLTRDDLTRIRFTK